MIFCLVMLFLTGAYGLFLTTYNFTSGDWELGIITGVLSLGCLALVLFLWITARRIIQYVSFDRLTLIILSPLKRRRIEVKAERIMGFSKSWDEVSWGTEFLKRNCLTLYFLDNISPIEFVQYQVNGIKEFEKALRKAKVNFLGVEEIFRDYFGQRTYFEFERHKPPGGIKPNIYFPR